MPTRDDAWPDGTPCWVDCQVDDPTAAGQFYTALFGWDVQESPPEAGGYLMALRSGRPSAGIGGKPQGAGSMPSAWTTYLATSDVDATVAKVKSAGGTVFMDPFDVMDVGRMTMAADPTGAAFGLWQAKSHKGVGIFNESGGLCWNELRTRDYKAARDFYAAVFGYTYDEMGGGSTPYSLAKRAGDNEGIAGISLIGEESPADMPASWLAWFAVDNCDEAVEKVKRSGRRVLREPSDSPFGRMAVVQGPEGEVFGVIGLATAGESSESS